MAMILIIASIMIMIINNCIWVFFILSFKSPRKLTSSRPSPQGTEPFRDAQKRQKKISAFGNRAPASGRTRWQVNDRRPDRGRALPVCRCDSVTTRHGDFTTVMNSMQSHMNIYMQSHTAIYMQALMNIYVHTHILAHALAFPKTHAHKHTHSHTDLHTHTYEYTYTLCYNIYIYNRKLHILWK